MSFTEDELQAFNSILEQRFAVHRQEMEQYLDQRLNAFQYKTNQWLISLSQELFRNLKQWIYENGIKPGVDIMEKLDVQHAQVVQMFGQETAQRQQHIEAVVDRMLAAQLVGMEQLLNQHGSLHSLEAGAFVQSIQPQLEALEMQTELPWEDLARLMGQALDERLAPLSSSLRHSIANLEQYLMLSLQGMREEFVRNQAYGQASGGSLNSVSSVQEILEGTERLERIIESMQIAMTANQALLSDRLYHHQQLPLDRAHPIGPSQPVQTAEPAQKERATNGQEGAPLSQPNKTQESEGQ